MKYVTHFFVLTILLAPTVIFAQPLYQPLVGLPGTSEGGTLDANSDFNTYINALYALSIGIAALLAVIKIIIAGVKWMLTDIVTSKEEAKKDIKGALLGLIIVLSAVLILTVINPQLVKVDLTMNQLERLGYVDNSVPVVLDMSLVKSYPTSIGMSLSEDPRQVKAFRDACPTNPPGALIENGEAGDIRCFNLNINQKATYFYYCAPGTPAEGCDTIRTALRDQCVNNSGTWVDEPSTPSGWRMYSCVENRF
jgi:hypothetical protein